MARYRTLRAGRFDQALKALEDVDPSIATATQSARLQALKHDAGSLRIEALEAAARQRKERREQIRLQFETQLTTIVSAARRASMDRRFQVGAGLVAALTVVLLWTVPSGPSPVATRVSSSPSQGAERVVVVPEVRPLLTDRPRDLTAKSVVAGAPLIDPVEAALASVGDLSAAGNFVEAFTRLDRLPPADRRVSTSRGQVESAWNEAAQETATRARQLAEAGDFGGALVLVGGFQPVHGFVDAARDDVEAGWAADGAEVSRRALEMAAAGNHDGAVALLAASDPPHASVVATLGELRANPTCSAELPSVLDALSGFRFESGASRPQIVTLACDDSFRVEIQNELVRFGARCERASATAFVPVLCQGSSTWSDPFVLSFVLGKSSGYWVITEAVELEPNPSLTPGSALEN